MLAFIGCLFLGPRVCGQSSTAHPLPADQREQMVLDEKHFQARKLETLKTARANYVAFTNREARHEFAARVIAESGIDERWQRKILLPYSETNQNLTPTLNKPLQVVTGYKVLRSLGDGDALIEAQEVTCLVMNFSQATNLPSASEAWLIKEGEKAYTTAPGEYQRIEAFTNVRLNKEETAVLNRVVTACQKKAAALAREISAFGATSQEFEILVRRATDSNPFLQYQVAKAYLDGKGTRKDETLGMQWMNKAAKNGSGDAQSYLDSVGSKAP